MMNCTTICTIWRNKEQQPEHYELMKAEKKLREKESFKAIYEKRIKKKDKR